ncbi:nuclear transport factor 2 family protein [Pseudomaricurvus alcaniphilus]|uniref:nuclear transport factor 2 family protein n=1 Tax=Pseudomaricurvus alcaniphilus TaxID=1166482 RepID=UPI001409013A|nr:nuclear transport factor 2 family protein [Pseudomaricurvus alcaniphilus]NHN38224.1 nuclear transport factor 2 family protein [Pseudomaricurvus alcaniphilus]
MSAATAETITAFIHQQVACWNAGDKDGFFQSYRAIATGNLTIEYVGKHSGDGWPILKGMWEQNQPKIDIEEVEMILNGNEVACHNRNKLKGSDLAIETIEIYRFEDNGDLHIRYFIRQPG